MINSGWLYANGGAIGRLQRVLDVVVIGFIFYVYQPNATWETDYFSLPTILIVMGIGTIILTRAGIYKSCRHEKIKRIFQRLNSSWISIVCLIILATFLNKSSASYSRVAMALWAVSSWIWLIVMHISTRTYLRNIRKIGLNSRTILYWGEPEAAKNFSNELSKNPWLGYRIIAWFSPVEVSKIDQPNNLPACSGGIDELKKWLEKYNANSIVFSTTKGNKKIGKENIFDLFGNTYSRILYAPDWYMETMKFESTAIGKQNCIEIWGTKQAYDERILKRVFDLCIATTIIVMILPLLVIISIAVKMSSNGPIIFRQKRCGLNGKVFICYKFRSMYYSNNNQFESLKQASRNDERITYIGRFLRKWSLDELPQLINVIKGDMSLVGPRPHAIEHDKSYRKLITGYSQRHTFKPGITGLAQVSGYRGETKEVSAMEARIFADLEYQKNWSITKDIEILCRTFLIVLNSDAY